MLNLLAAGSASAAPGWTGFVPIIGMILIFWFLLFRPQMKRQKEHAAKIESIKKGDQVVTAGGLVGKIVKVEDHYAHIDLGGGVKVKAVKATIGDVIQPGAAAPAND